MTTVDPFPDITIGYPKLAAKIEILPEAAIYRKFGALNAQNLLYYQAELTYLEEELRKQQTLDNNDQTGYGQAYAINWFWLKRSKIYGEGRQLDLVLEIRELLAKYSESIIPRQRKDLTPGITSRRGNDPTGDNTQVPRARCMGSPSYPRLLKQQGHGALCNDWS